MYEPGWSGGHAQHWLHGGARGRGRARPGLDARDRERRDRRGRQPAGAGGRARAAAGRARATRGRRARHRRRAGRGRGRGGHGGHAGMSMAAMARDMRNRFLVALVFAIPIVLWSPLGAERARHRPRRRRSATADVWQLLLSLPVVFYASWIFFRGAWRALRARTLDMMVLVAVAIGTGSARSPRRSGSRARCSTRPPACSRRSCCSGTLSARGRSSLRSARSQAILWVR